MSVELGEFSPAPRPLRRAVARRHRVALVYVGVGLLATAFRLAVVAHSRGGFAGAFGYDQGVYYSAADAFTFGRLPYRDFVLLHPPGLMLVLAPFAVLGRLTSDHTGFVVANAAFVAVASVNATLVTAIARRRGLALSAAALGGAFYAVWFGAVDAEFTLRLEPLGTMAFLLGIFVLSRPEPQGGRAALAGGAALGFAVAVKIWWIVPVVVVLIWYALIQRARVRSGLAAVVGAVGCPLVVFAPFFWEAPSAMWRMVVTEQLGRPHSTGLPDRIADVFALHGAFPHLASTARDAAIVGVAGVLIGVALVAWRGGRGKIFVVLLAAQVAVLATSPGYFSFYAAYPVGALALVVAAAAQPACAPTVGRATRSRGANRSRSVVVVAAIVGVSGVLSVLGISHSLNASTPFPASKLAAQASHVTCLMSDSPTALIELNALSRGLAHGCPNWIDVTGQTYGRDKPEPNPLPRIKNLRWQRDIAAYLRSGDGFIVIRPSTGINAETRRELNQSPVVASAGGYALRRTPR